MAFQKTIWFLLAFFITFIPSSHAYTFQVGGKDGWTLHPSETYNSWSSRLRFLINDTLHFKYDDGLDSVLVVNKSDYDGCNSNNPITKMDGGDSLFKLDRSGPFYFITGDKSNCDQGQKLTVVVLALRHRSPPPSVATPPSHVVSPVVPPSISPVSPPSAAVSPVSPPSTAGSPGLPPSTAGSPGLPPLNPGSPVSPPWGSPGSSPLGPPKSSPWGSPNSSPLGSPESSPWGSPGSSPLGSPESSPSGAPNLTPASSPDEDPADSPRGGSANAPMGGGGPPPPPKEDDGASSPGASPSGDSPEQSAAAPPLFGTIIASFVTLMIGLWVIN